jgi:hypothetical protein
MGNSYPTIKELLYYKHLAKEYNVPGFSVAVMDCNNSEKPLYNTSLNKPVRKKKRINTRTKI